MQLRSSYIHRIEDLHAMRVKSKKKLQWKKSLKRLKHTRNRQATVKAATCVGVCYQWLELERTLYFSLSLSFYSYLSINLTHTHTHTHTHTLKNNFITTAPLDDSMSTYSITGFVLVHYNYLAYAFHPKRLTFDLTKQGPIPPEAMWGPAAALILLCLRRGLNHQPFRSSSLHMT